MKRALLWLFGIVGALILGAFVFALLRFGPTAMTLAWASGPPNGAPARPPLAADFDPEAARAALEREVYGSWPGNGAPEEGAPGEGASVEVVAAERLPYPSIPGAQLVNIDMALLAGTQRRPFGISLVRRDPADPLIVWSSFGPRGAAIPHPSVPGEPIGSVTGRLVRFVFGRYIDGPPLTDVLDRGYGFAVLHPPEALPDSAASLAVLDTMMGGETTDGEADSGAGSSSRPGAIIAWAWLAAEALDALEAEGEALGAVVAGGHSRYGKAALVWAAWDGRVDAVVAHQSGTGGAALSRDKRGETVAQMTESYPWWFAPGYAEDALNIDQHYLLALLAPRPVLLGGARRDVWSDPNGALRAAIGAAPAWRARGVAEPLPARDLYDFRPSAPIALWTRPGTHGIVEEDWPAFLQFLDAHFQGG